jgi:hypothetical protein
MSSPTAGDLDRSDKVIKCKDKDNCLDFTDSYVPYLMEMKESISMVL